MQRSKPKNEIVFWVLMDRNDSNIYSLQYTTTDVLQRIAKVKRLYPNCILSLHLYESIEERTCIERRMKRNALNVLQEYGLVDPSCLVSMVHLWICRACRKKKRTI